MGSWFTVPFFSDDNSTINPPTSTPNNYESQSVTQKGPKIESNSTNNADIDSNDPLSNVSMQSIVNNDKEYSASAASSGHGYFGETAILGKTFIDEQETKLPLDAIQILDVIQTYLQSITSNDTLMKSLSSADQKCVTNAWNGKLKDNLTEMIQTNTMSNYAYNILNDIISALQSHNYDIANQKLTEIIKNKKEFKTNKIWLLTFKSVIRIAKQQQI